MSKNTSAVHLGDDGIIRVTAAGNMTEAATKRLMGDVEVFINELHSQNKKVLLLIDQSRVDRGNTAARRQAAAFFKRIKYGRIAIFDPDTRHRNATNYFINTIGLPLRIRTFKTEAKALTWLTRKRVSPKTSARRALLFAGFLTILAFAWQHIFAPQLLQLPENFSYQASVVSYDNFYDEQKARYNGKTLSNTQFTYSVIGARDGVLDVKNVFDVRTAAAEPIFAVDRIYGIDQQTRQHVPERGDQPRTGYLFAPQNLAKQDFVYWHVNYNQPAVMKFQEEEDILGLQTYRYKADYHADQTQDLTHLPQVGTTRGVNLDISLQIWVEPSTGHLVKYQDVATAYFYDLATGKRLNPWNQFENSYHFESVAAQVNSAERQKQSQAFIQTTVPLFLAAFALILLVRWAVFVWQGRQQKTTHPFQTLVVHKTGNPKSVLLALLVLSLMILVTVLAWQQAIANVTKQSNIQFQSDANEMHRLVTDELLGYVRVLESARGLFAASTAVSREEWREYIESLHLPQEYPGMLGIGFAQMVAPEQKAAHEAGVRAEGFPNYRIFPDGSRDIYSSVVYLEPFNGRNQRAFGYDMFSDPVRREAMERARDTGEPAMSGKVSLVQETGADPQGVLIYVPVYKKGMPVTSVAERKTALAGYVYAPIRMSDFMLVTIGNQAQGLNVSLYDTADANSLTVADRLFVTNKNYGIENASYSSDFLRTESAMVAARPLTFRYVNLPTYSAGTSQSVPRIVLASGIGLSVLLTALTYLLSSSRQRALKLANAMTIDLRNERDRAITTQHKDQAILRSIGDGVFVVDASGRIKLFNKAAEAITGQAASDAIGKPYKQVLHFYNETDGNPADHFIKQAMAGSRSEMARHTALKRPDGSVVPVADSAAPIINSRGVIEGVVVVFRDISRERELERAKDDFLSMASHELRTPMGAVRANISMMLSGDYGPVNKGLVEPLNDVHSSTVRLVELVNDLLDASRIEAGRMKFVIGNHDIRELIKQTVAELAPLGKENGLKIALTSGATATVQVDPGRLRQVVTNLIGNAIKFTQKGGITLGIKVQNDRAEVSVTDTGIGIAQDEQTKLFAKFSQISSAQAGKPPGTGLGLYISREIIRKMGGELWLKDSAAGKGSTFALTLPLADTPTAHKAAVALAREAGQHPDQK